MCKTGKKMSKINFNKFICVYWKMRKNIYIVKIVPTAQTVSRYNGKLYRDIAVLGVQFG